MIKIQSVNYPVFVRVLPYDNLKKNVSGKMTKFRIVGIIEGVGKNEKN